MDRFIPPFAFEIGLAVLAALLSLLMPHWLLARMGPLATQWKRLVPNHRRGLWISLAFPVVFHILFSPVYPPPQPVIADEFSHLLVGDTLLHGRLANLTHPLWRHFETLYVIFNPSYSSIYAPGPGAALALPQLFGLPPYVGLWLTAGLLSAATYWMLLAWFPPHWALAGPLIVMPRITVLSYWVHSYWGGSVAAIGGALAIGAAARLMTNPSPGPAWIFGIGVFIVVNSRLYEGAVLTAALGAVLIVWLWKNGSLRKVLPPLAVMAAVTLSFVAFHNYRVTGDPSKLPYQKNRELYGTPQGFYWQAVVPPVPSPHPAIRQNYQAQLDMHEFGKSPGVWRQMARDRLFDLWLFFAGPIWTPALLFMPWLSSRYRLALIAWVLVILATLFYPFWFSHYYAPVASVFVLIVLAGLQRARGLLLCGRPSGRAFSHLLLLFCSLAYCTYIAGDIYAQQYVHQPKIARTQLMEALSSMGGQHVVFVHYRPDHNYHKEVVYNAADIDGSPIVWARDAGPLGNLEVLQYFPSRKFWLFEPDESPPRLSPYAVSPGAIPGRGTIPGRQ